MRSVFKRLGGLAAATVIALLVTAAPSYASAATGTVTPNATAIEYGL
ncbi:hypothetical protein [Catenulispora pinisilvae]|nr:hypothetical protein [Catenulispora pinisilvae]